MINCLIILFVTLTESFSRFWQMKQAAFLSGVDAYYYALQIKFFVKTGALKIPDSSPLLHLMGWTAKLGLSYEHTIILWIVFIQFACFISILIAYRLIHGKKYRSLFIAPIVTWVVLSPTLAFTCIEFPKYAFSFIFLPFWPVGMIHKRLWPVSIGAVILSCVSHLTMICILALVLCGLLIAGITRMKSNRIKKPLLIAGSIGLVGSFGLIFGKFFLLSDLSRIHFQGLQPSLWTFFSRTGLPLLLKIEVLVGVIINVILIIWAIKGKSQNLVRFWTPFIIFLLVVPLGSQEVMGIPERLCLMLPLLTISSLMGVQINLSGLAKTLSYLGVCLALVVVALFPKLYLNWVHPDRLNPDYPLYDQVTTAIARRQIPMLIAHQGLNYYYKYKTMKESFPYEPEAHWPNGKIWRVVYGVTPSEWAYYLPEKFLWGSGLLFSLPGPYSLVREDCWEQFRKGVYSAADDELKDLVFHSWLNPSERRPEFVRKRAEKDNDGEFSAYPEK